MEDSDVVGMVWETLAQAETPCTAQNIMELSGLGASEVRRALAALREGKLLSVTAVGTSFSYAVLAKLDAMRWARAADLGVPLKVLERYGVLASNGDVHAVALKLALDGKVEAETRQRAARKKKERETLVMGRAATQLAATDLARLASDARAAILTSKESSSGKTGKALTKKEKAKEKAMRDVLEKAVSEVDRVLQGLLGRIR